MKLKSAILAFAVLVPLTLLAQGPPQEDGGGPPPPPPAAGMPPMGPHGHGGRGHDEMGKWWQNSEVAQKLQLSNQQIAQLDQIFLDHRLKLVDEKAAMEKQDLKLQALLDQDSPADKDVSTQVDQVLAAKGQLEREVTMMHLALRKVLSVDQWRALKAMHEERGPGRHMGRGPGAGDPAPPTPPGF